MKWPKQLVENELWKGLESRNPPVSMASFAADKFKDCYFTSFKCRLIVNQMRIIQNILKSTFLTRKVA